MPAFLIAEISGVYDEAMYARYREQVSPSLAEAGGTYLVRGGRVEVLEGSWRPNRLVIVSFDSVEAARRWWDSPQYAELKTMRQHSTKTNMIIVEGINDANRK